MPWLPLTRRNQARLALLGLAARGLAPASASPPPPGAPPRRVLLLRPDHIGDVLLSAPAVGLLRASLPAAHLTYVVGPWSAEAAQRGPAVDRLWTLAYPGFTRQPAANPLAPYLLLARVARHWRRQRFDLAVVLRPDHWWGALLAAAAGIPVRVGARTPETAALLSHARPAVPGEHAAEQSLALVRLALAACGGLAGQPVDQPVFSLTAAARAAADAAWRQHALADQRVVALHPSAGAALKSWPVGRWAALGDSLRALGVQLILVGAPADRELLLAIQARMAEPAAMLACGQSLTESAALYARSSLLIALDSGAAHLAAAVGTPTLRLYGPAAVRTFGPWPSRPDQQVLLTGDLACVPCGHLVAPPCGAATLPACLLALGTADVVNAARRQLEQG